VGLKCKAKGQRKEPRSRETSLNNGKIVTTGRARGGDDLHQTRHRGVKKKEGVGREKSGSGENLRLDNWGAFPESWVVG